MSRGKLRSELGGDPYSAVVSVRVATPNVGAITPCTTVAVISSEGVAWWEALDTASRLPPGRVPLQQSSAFDDGTHFPFLQHSADFCVNGLLPKQSNGFNSKRTAITVTAMCMPRRILI